MKICIVSMANNNTGLGHFYRATTLAATAHEMGHEVTFICDRLPNAVSYRTVLLPDNLPLYVTNSPDRYDWVVVDTPSELPLPVHVDPDIKLCLIDGVGHQNGHKPDLVISQGFEGSEYCAPEYLILRPELFNEHPSFVPTDKWLVWGGAADKMGLLTKFNQACPDYPAFLAVSEMMDGNGFVLNEKHWVTSVQGHTLALWAGICSKFCVAQGMILWELLVLCPGRPIYVFSYTERHLRSALQFQERGWCKAYPETGIPEPKEMRRFLSSPFTPVVALLDSRGAERIVRLLEGKR